MLQVLRNLLGPAVKLSQPRDFIELGIEHREQNGVVTVNNQGIGIPAGEEGAIFDRCTPSNET